VDKNALPGRPFAWGPVLSIIVGLLYGASPVDLVPDILPLIGWVDDAVLMPLLIALGVVGLLRRRKAQRALAKTPAR
jgi:uncharacterized membrane protein YkvA (DUF1232 family)